MKKSCLRKSCNDPNCAQLPFDSLICSPATTKSNISATTNPSAVSEVKTVVTQENALFNTSISEESLSETKGGCNHDGCGCDHTHTNDARNILIGFTGVFILLMIGYMAFSYKKSSSSRSKFTEFPKKELVSPPPPHFTEKSVV